MSYCRFSNKNWELYGIKIPKSDVYVFESVYGGIECCGCRLTEGRSPTYDKYSDMIHHLQKHMEAGHAVPAHVIPMLEEMILTYGDEVDGQ